MHARRHSFPPFLQSCFPPSFNNNHHHHPRRLPPTTIHAHHPQVKFPPYVTPAAIDLIVKLLERKPTKRLGMLSGRANDIKKHKW